MPQIVRRVGGIALTNQQVDDHVGYVDVPTPIVLTINSGIITVDGPGVYRILPQSGTADDLTQINGAIGHEEPIILRLNTVGHVITVIHTPPNLRLSPATFIMDSIYDTIGFRSPAVNVWAEVWRKNIPPT